MCDPRATCNAILTDCDIKMLTPKLTNGVVKLHIKKPYRQWLSDLRNTPQVTTPATKIPHQSSMS